MSRAAATKSHPAALTRSAAWSRPHARASWLPCQAKSDPRSGCTPLALHFPLFPSWALLGEGGVFLSPSGRPLTSTPAPSRLRALYSSSNFSGGCVPEASVYSLRSRDLPPPPVIVLTKG